MFRVTNLEANFKKAQARANSAEDAAKRDPNSVELRKAAEEAKMNVQKAERVFRRTIGVGCY